ncbi:carbohydrate ABC transporter permease [Oceaniglobus trochenteri]|uniref:carbohydrate ABC transporter permease n=1 Tax=Oceaniglobus trochenteri TaxID=2763260 RepID=UPI001CFF8367|nr:carbohydrate ABC transporter permease [Oceaniglobus trochenteri]
MAVSRHTRRMNLIAHGVGLGFALFSVLPIVWLVITSFKTEAEIVTDTITFLPQSLQLQNYRDVWAQSNYPSLMWNSIVTTFYTVTICMVAGSLAAYSFSRNAFPLRRELMLFYLVVRMFPAVLIIIPLFLILRTVGLLDTRFGLSLAYASFLLPLFVWMMKGFFDAVPPDLERAARIDGCTRIGAMVRVVLPLVKGGLGACAVFVAIGAWNEYLFALMLTSSAGSRTWPVGLQMMVGEFQLPWGLLAASGVISILPVVALFAIVQRAMVRGLTVGAIKG